ncbi:MAG TPA: phosphoribosylanthranilate isomerase [Dissulfurispiraceae bacterium]|nr:phosphoribosylanthranilate isomerase [Dissulfurispiraceae bacterium]
MQVVRVKICGITNTEDALAAASYGADALGFIFYRESPRYISPDRARDIVSQLPPFLTTVGVFVKEADETMKETMELAGLDTLQLHGDEPPEACAVWPRVIKAFRVKDFIDLEPLEHCRVSAFLLDTYSPHFFGGTGLVFNWDIAVEAKRYGKVILSGGLTPDNVAQAVRWVKPYAVDVSSGVEASKGKKDLKKLRDFIERAKAAVS